MKSKIIVSGILAIVLLAGCKKDNFKTPQSKITGRVVYQGQPLSVRSNGVQLELWQKGYQLFTKVPVYVNYDGTFSTEIFDGDYLLTRLKGNGPWADMTDTIPVHLSGSASVDVPVDPYFIISNPSFTKSGTTVNATFTLKRVNTTKNLEVAKIYIGRTLLTDQSFNDASAQKLAADITDLTQPVTLSVAIPAALVNNDYVYARIGVKTLGVSEYIYSMPVQIPYK